jgi:hypothetical protein
VWLQVISFYSFIPTLMITSGTISAGCQNCTFDQSILLGHKSGPGSASSLCHQTRRTRRDSISSELLARFPSRCAFADRVRGRLPT